MKHILLTLTLFLLFPFCKQGLLHAQGQDPVLAGMIIAYTDKAKKELKQQKIIETGFLRKTKVMEGDYTKSYFTKADKRTLNSIALHSKKAQVMSKHPADSYAIEDAGGQKVLHILNPNKFWELSNYLVVKID